MKKLIGWLLILLMLLTGCQDNGSPEATPEATDATVSTGNPDPSVPADAGLYQEGSPLEVQTQGAVLAFLPEKTGSARIVPMGKDHLLFQKDQLTLLTGEQLTPVVTVSAPGIPMPGSGWVQIQEKGVAYYDSKHSAIVFLGSNLREIGKLNLSDDITGGVYLTPDWSTLYYCTVAGIHTLDLSSGVSRILKAQSAVAQSITGGLLDGEVLRCTMKLADGSVRTLLIWAKDGSTITQGDHLTTMVSSGNRYFLTRPAGLLPELIFRQDDDQAYTLWPAEEAAVCEPLPEIGAAITVARTGGQLLLSYYDLSTGLRSASLTLETDAQPTNFSADPAKGGIWFQLENTLCFWDPTKSPTGDTASYITPRHTREDPDEAGLTAISSRIQQLEETYQVDILFWEEAAAVVPWDYSFETEYLVPSYEEALQILESSMAKFPEGFFPKCVQWAGSAPLKIVLVRGIYGSAGSSTHASAPGIQYMLDGEIYIALSIDDTFEQTFYHELYHVLETPILSHSTACYEWSTLNPPGFQYDNDYLANLNRNDSWYLEDGNRYFIDTYSMSFAKEDRARIFEYASMPGNAAYFSGKVMQEKLSRICRGIREVFRLKEEAGTLPWEQYLTTK